MLRQINCMIELINRKVQVKRKSPKIQKFLDGAGRARGVYFLACVLYKSKNKDILQRLKEKGSLS